VDLDRVTMDPMVDPTAIEMEDPVAIEIEALLDVILNLTMVEIIGANNLQIKE